MNMKIIAAIALAVALMCGAACGTDTLEQACTVATQEQDCYQGFACDTRVNPAICRRLCENNSCPSIAYRCDSQGFCQKVAAADDAGTD